MAAKREKGATTREEEYDGKRGRWFMRAKATEVYAAAADALASLSKPNQAQLQD